MCIRYGMDRSPVLERVGQNPRAFRIAQLAMRCQSERARYLPVGEEPLRLGVRLLAEKPAKGGKRWQVNG